VVWDKALRITQLRRSPRKYKPTPPSCPTKSDSISGNYELRYSRRRLGVYSSGDTAWRSLCPFARCCANPNLGLAYLHATSHDLYNVLNYYIT
jgi:hypothetical protein